MTLRTKLLLAQAPLVLVLLALGLTTLRTVSVLGRSSQDILKDNYRSALAAERMAGAAAALDRAALRLALGRPPAEVPAELEALARRCEAELRFQEANVTEPGEGDATRELRARWTSFRAAGAQLRTLAPPRRPAFYLEAVEPAAAGFARAAAEVLGINQEAMVRRSERAHREAQKNNQLVMAATVGALLLGIFATGTLTARLLRPLSLLTQSVRRIGEGDLQVRARVQGSDEIGQLAREFNTMADRLGQYRSSSLGELLQAQQASQAAIDSLPDPVLVLDASGGLVNVNDAAEAVLRLSQAGAGDPLLALAPPLRTVIEQVRAHVVGGKGPYVPRGFEEAVRAESPDGDRFLLPRATPLYSEEGTVAGATVLLQDVTRLMRFDELKNDLVATVAHEFRTPITSLRMAIHLCAEEVVGPLTDKQADLLQAAREDCERLQSIVDDLLDLSRIQAGRIELHRKPVPAAALLEEAARALRQAAQAAELSLQAESPEPSPQVSADPERVQLILGNLVSNAVRYTPAGGSITLSVAVEGAVARFAVKDTGAGVPREYQERIFEKFFRVPGDRSGGVGLGLYIAREIVQAHGGQMGVESAPEHGATFWFTLPLA
ncbi:MAG TPA: ATP-binding protein [Anaeromyxobacteraceae bacterium]|jgi:signal transduction histidine kinase/HAMP domain-containing protein|nr:ATP-binding protein [Anaeromyxobacteraceae bacterium]